MRSQHRWAYRPDIDGLRALAILAVLVFHLNPAVLPGGFAGVDVFFVISGFLISSITTRHILDQSFTFVEFYGRRARRLLPALLVVLIATLVGGLVWLGATEYRALGTHVASAVAYASNFTLWRESGYFDADSELKPLLHLWSLAVEEQFYFAWPIFSVWLLRRTKRPERGILLVLTISLLGGLILIAFDRASAFYLSPFRFWEILVGAWLAHHRDPERWRRHKNLLAGGGFVLIAVAGATFNRHHAYPGTRALLPTLGAAALIMAGPTAHINRWLLGHPVMTWVGRISYPLYLWHWPIIVYLHLLAPSSRTDPYYQCAAAAVAFGLAQITHTLIERPAIARLDPRRSAWILLVPWIFCGILGTFIRQRDGLSGRWPGLDEQLRAVTIKPWYNAADESCPEALRSSPALAFCLRPRGQTATGVVFGDSHAAHIYPALIGPNKDGRWLLAGHGACAPILRLNPRLGDECPPRIAKILRYVRETPSITTVVLSYYAGSARTPDFEADLDRMITALEDAGRRVVVTFDVPALNFPPRDCIQRPLALETTRDCAVERSVVDDEQRESRALTARLVKHHPRVVTYDPVPKLCDHSVCRATRGDQFLYFDTHHLTEIGSHLAFADLREVIGSASLNKKGRTKGSPGGETIRTRDF